MGTRLEILREHCSAFERALAGAQTLKEAEEVRARSCRQLADSCHSEMLLVLLQEHAQTRIRARFPSR